MAWCGGWHGKLGDVAWRGGWHEAWRRGMVVSVVRSALLCVCEREREMRWEEREKVNKIRINFFGIFVLIVSYLRVYYISMPKILRFEISDEG